ncbi:MAG: alpha-amylase family glycosyl hydrolase [Candidatus Limnocylindrales bacterium]
MSAERVSKGLVEPIRDAAYGDDWWRRAVVYQVYPRSFADHDGDGVGDLAGLIDHLDHLNGSPESLGVDAIWLSPIYPSPGRDVGYDVTDHATVDPLLGSEEDFDRLIVEAHRRGLRVILDLVMNHTSNESAWFMASRSSRDGPFGDWYLWRDPAGVDGEGRPLPPNNWLSWFGGSAWQWDDLRGQFYQHTFLAEQPELNWRNPAVEDAQFEMVRGWLDRGVDGFRLDVFNVFLKHPDLLANPVRQGRTAWERQEHIHDRDSPDFPLLIGRFREIVDERPGRMSVGELFGTDPQQAAALAADRHLVFDWELVTQPWSADAFRTAIERREAVFAERWPTVVLSNHDRPRLASRLADSVGAVGEDRDAIARAAAVLQLTIRGTPFLYYGDELGLDDVAIPPDESIDPPAARAGPDFPWWDRSQCRTPMPWTSGPGAGFTTGRPWLRLGPDHEKRNVAVQATQPDSVLACYRRLLRARRELASLQDGALSLVVSDDPGVLAFRRLGSGPEVLVVVAFGAGGARVPIEPPGQGGTWRVVVGSRADVPVMPNPGEPLVLRPYEACVAVAVESGT